MANAAAPKDIATRLIDAAAPTLVELSHRVHATPETCYEEHRSSVMVADLLSADPRFNVEFGVAGLETAFVATAGTGPLHLSICAEYDALPGIGHACGHNIIASAAVGTGLALAALADDLGITVTVHGCPAEEGGGGKIRMLEAGMFDGIHAAMMVHPSPVEADRMHCLSVSHFDVTYRGKTAHASAFPQDGINAADAITVAQVGLGLLRQHIKSTDRIHGIVTKGGDAPNIIPDHTIYKTYVRARTIAELETLMPRVANVFAAGAIATGCRHEIVHFSPPYSEFHDDEDTLALYRANAESLGRSFPAPQKRRPQGQPHDGEHAFSASTDMANVSLRIPSIHPMLGIDARGASNHQPGFAAACAESSADHAVRDGALAMALTCIDLATDHRHRTRLLARTESLN